MMDNSVEVRFFGNGKKHIRPGMVHAVKTRPYTRLDTDAGTLPAEKMFTCHEFESTLTTTFAVLRVGEDRFTKINIKCLDYVKPLRAR